MKTQPLAAIVWLLSVIPACTNESNEQVQNVDLLKNSTWRFVAFEKGDTTSSVDAADTILLSFREKGIIQGSSSGLCGNDYHGWYFFGEASTIHFDSLFSSKALCPRSRYWDYYGKLHAVTSFKLESLRLYLSTVNTGEKLVFERKP